MPSYSLHSGRQLPDLAASMHFLGHSGVVVLGVVVLSVVVLDVVVLVVVVLDVVVVLGVVVLGVVVFGGGVGQHLGMPSYCLQLSGHCPSLAASTHSSGHATT